MALKINFKKNFVYTCPDLEDSKDYEVNYPNCYVNIGNITGMKTLLRMKVDYYTDVSKTKFLQSIYVNFTPSVADGSKNFIAQGYDYLKTLDEFKDAEDC